jgi:NarL family two-component system response regulator LiaR
LSARIARRVSDSAADVDSAPQNPFATLSPRESDVLRLIARGHTNTEIASVLVLSENTVKGYVSMVLSKLQVTDRTQAAIVAWREGLVGAHTPD